MKLRTPVLISVLFSYSLTWLLIGSAASASTSPPQILISELQTNGGTGHSTNEFIELYNPTDTDVLLSGWSVQYHSASNSDCVNGWSKTPKITLPAIAKIKGYGYYLIAATGYLTVADSRFTAGLSDTAGTIRVLRPDLSTSDALAWGNSACGIGAAAPSPTLGRSLERRPGDDAPLAGNGDNAADNSQDFSLRLTPQPQSTLSDLENPDLVDPIAIPTTTYLPIHVTELLIDPVSPATDAHDEFVEVQNPNSEPLNLGGYIIKTPSSQFHLSPMILAPGQFAIITSADSTLSLANDGGNIQVFDPAGTLVDESAPWPKAIAGAAWASFPEGWSWTLNPTPAAANILKELPEAPITSGSNIPAITVIDSTISYLSLQITELYIDPISPQTDDKNEFVELYNPNDEPVDIFGYGIKSGSNLGNNATFDHHIIAAHEYIALYSSETGLPLSNTGSTVQLFDPAGVAIGSFILYAQAKTGLSWILSSDGTWQWTTTLTPGANNVLTTPVVAVKPTVVAKAIVNKAKTVTVKKPVVAKPKKTTQAKAKLSKTANSPAPIASALHKTSGNTLILILLGLTICYVIYEFRYDLRHTYHRLRGHTKPRT